LVKDSQGVNFSASPKQRNLYFIKISGIKKVKKVKANNSLINKTPEGKFIRKT